VDITLEWRGGFRLGTGWQQLQPRPSTLHRVGIGSIGCGGDDGLLLHVDQECRAARALLPDQRGEFAPTARCSAALAIVYPKRLRVERPRRVGLWLRQAAVVEPPARQH